MLLHVALYYGKNFILQNHLCKFQHSYLYFGYLHQENQGSRKLYNSLKGAIQIGTP